MLFAAIAVFLGLVSYYLYFKSILRNETRPHLYTWLIWGITTGTVTAGVWHGGGGLGTLGSLVNSIGAISVLLFSFKYGTKNIRVFDAFMLIAALCAVGVWWQLKNPLLAVFMVTAIDLIGYVPTFRKSYEEPWTESLLSWGVWVPGIVCSILALNEYNLLTLTYYLAIDTANMALIILCLMRRRFVPRAI